MSPTDLVRDVSGGSLVIGICNDVERWINAAYNYGMLRNGKVYHHGIFAYFLTTEEHFLAGLELAFRGLDWNGSNAADLEQSKWRPVSWAWRARKLLDNIPYEPFYRHLTEENRLPVEMAVAGPQEHEET